MFDVVIRRVHTHKSATKNKGISTPQNTQQNSASKHRKTEATGHHSDKVGVHKINF
jgi:hypothetical protein